MNFAVVIYHEHCVDGFTAAWVAWSQLGDGAAYVPAKYGSKPPDVAGKDVLVLDFSYPREVLLDMAGKARTLRVLDHHASAQRNLAGLTFCKFDMERSGAGLAWDELCPDAPRPLLVNLVEDRDLWRFKLMDSKALSAWISVQPREFERWDELEVELLGDYAGCVAKGNAILDHIAAYIDATAKNARMMDVLDHYVPVVNAPGMMASELVGHLAENADFAVGWFQRVDGRYQYSLRSRGDVDVAEIAETFGGAGHRGAAGFDSIMPPSWLFDDKPRERDTDRPPAQGEEPLSPEYIGKLVGVDRGREGAP